MKKLQKTNLNDLNQELKNGKYMLFFTADWCPDCRFIKPAMPAIEAEYSEYTFLMVDRDENIDLAGEMGIMGIPSFVAYSDGEEIGRFNNGDRKTKAEVENFINSLSSTVAK
ncbi:thioredoxin family protein [Lentilactobacillus kefiri]|uniref:Thiol reductase thioredoxin n=1 Tax=Lentilactobacillus kefiri TaxID=33962 RepID=A0A511DUN7_LENKE|nr:thioredoxin family protein [Lentilactobacillus kefiri]MCJ2161026.1 thioredoxin family protein [Lentilactobacillus kefiri]MCP9368941.1 thioredoxin family protein [Lentilactobacillus kefiri]MDH5108173.1 thioredoxin family protein [Lentilactobacillus kefiri]MDM7492714.1 thioredoxin family protein [Lentilactobacillus kefiri]PAK60536.1 thioredoxin [Lentilactobacillus kefiri]